VNGEVSLIAGVDEAGRGPLAGPVAAVAVILDPERPIFGLADSKRLTPEQREALDQEIRAKALTFAVAFATVEEIDRINILQASLLAMQRAVENLSITPQWTLVDGNRRPRLACPVETIVKGDASINVISAASILAKVARDREMSMLDDKFPSYGFARHEGYPTRAHLSALRELGPCVLHTDAPSDRCGSCCASPANSGIALTTNRANRRESDFYIHENIRVDLRDS